MRTKKPSRTQIKKELQTVINELAYHTDCTFWACPGPDRPFADMATCRKCSAVKDLRRIRDKL